MTEQIKINIFSSPKVDKVWANLNKKLKLSKCCFLKAFQSKKTKQISTAFFILFLVHCITTWIYKKLIFPVFWNTKKKKKLKCCSFNHLEASYSCNIIKFTVGGNFGAFCHNHYRKYHYWLNKSLQWFILSSLIRYWFIACLPGKSIGICYCVVWALNTFSEIKY